METERINELDCDADTMLEFFLQEDYRAEVKRYMDMYESYYAGSRRVTFIGDDYVYKVPMNTGGDIANMEEAKHYHNNLMSPEEAFIPIAPCHMIDNGVLRMEKVEIPLDRLDLKEDNEWVGYVDSVQVGYLPNGELVAYDL